MNKTIFFATVALAIILCAPGASAQKSFTIASPSGKLRAEITVDKTVSYSVFHGDDLMLAPSPVSMELGDGSSFGVNAKFSDASPVSHSATIESPLYKKSQVADSYNELVLRERKNYSIVFRAYDDGIAYRFVSERRKPFTVVNEQAVFNFPEDRNAWVPYVRGPQPTSFENQFKNSFENIYTYGNLSAFDARRLAFTPVLVEGAGGKKVAIAEADLLSYPGMFLSNSDGDTALTGVFATYPKTVEQGGYNMLQGVIKEREPFIAKCEGATRFPWRAVIVSEKDIELADSDMVYRLAAPSRVKDASWIKPGKVAWEWWNGWNIYGPDVDFKVGVNNDTYKYYIDFASREGIEYVILDEGWAVNLQADLMQVVPAIDLQELVDYGRERNVGIILWAGYWAFDRDIEGVCKHFSEMGVKGFKIDFMDRDDQQMVDFHVRAAEIAAKYKMLVDFHGTYKPTGLNRTYPNVVNYEGVFGLEQMKWDPVDVDQVTYDVTVPFIRQIAGPLDYTQGAMRNANRTNYRAVYYEPMSQGTRCRQLAEYVVFESPLNMLCDSPTNYMKEPECTRFIAEIPTVWDRTQVIDGQVGKFITVAREKDGVWYLGSMTDWNARTLEIDLSFLGEGDFTAEVFMDGANANRVAMDYVKKSMDIPADRQISVRMAPGGGFAMKITRK